MMCDSQVKFHSDINESRCTFPDPGSVGIYLVETYDEINHKVVLSNAGW